MLGIVLIDKPLGLTSHDVISRLRKRFDTKRVGHAGTLDPLATGLLVVAIGPATRFLQYLPLEPKVYEAKIHFGIETNTQDAEGVVVADLPAPVDLAAEFARVLPQFRGLIQQVPPMFSAVKKDGKPLYAYARKGDEVERDARTVHIGEVETLAVGDATMDVRVSCSGGTYMRTWAHDIGKAIGCGAHLAGLRRTQVGRFSLEEAMSLDSVSPSDLIPLAEALPPVPLVHLSESQVAAIRNGQAVGVGRLGTPPERAVGLLDPAGDVIGMARAEGPVLQPECVIPALEG